METARCKAFQIAAETGSFTRAAEVLNYTPSGVSQLVTALEQELNLTLLRRTRRGVAMTTDGETLLPAVRDFLRQENHIYQLASALNNVLIGTIHIAAFSSITANWLPPVIHQFHREHPQVTLNLREGTSRQAERWLADKTADLAFYSYRENMPHDWFPLAEVEMLAIIPRSHPLAQADRYPLTQCRKDPLIFCSLGQDDDINELLRHNRMETVRPFITTVDNNSALAMVAQGLGVTFVNRLHTLHCAFDVAALPLDPPQSLTMGIALPSYRDASPAVHEFVRCAVYQLTGKPFVSPSSAG